ncbi:MAG TPA: signal peptidase I [Sandaracinaceae bacterium]
MRDFVKGTLKFFGVLLVIVLAAGGVLYAFFVKVVEIGHNAMAPTLIFGDRVLVWNTQRFAFGDVALCRHPQQPGRYVVGRVVGRPGQVVSIERGVLRISGDAPATDVRGTVLFADAETGRRVRMRHALEVLIDHDHHVFWREGSQPRMRRPHEVRSGLFLLSDNRTYDGEDSRTFGEVDPSTCIGRVFLRLTAAPSPPEVANGALDIIE